MSTSVFVHVLAPPVGFLEVNTYPFESPARHKPLDGQASAASALSTCDRFQPLAPARGFLVVRTFPPLSIATHSEAVGHRIATRARLAIDCGVDQESRAEIAASADRSAEDV